MHRRLAIWVSFGLELRPAESWTASALDDSRPLLLHPGPVSSHWKTIRACARDPTTTTTTPPIAFVTSVISPSRCGTGRGTRAGETTASPRSESSWHGPRTVGVSGAAAKANIMARVTVGRSGPAPGSEPGGAWWSRSTVPSRLGARGALVAVVAWAIPLLSLNSQLPEPMTVMAERGSPDAVLCSCRDMRAGGISCAPWRVADTVLVRPVPLNRSRVSVSVATAVGSLWSEFQVQVTAADGRAVAL